MLMIFEFLLIAIKLHEWILHMDPRLKLLANPVFINTPT